VTQNGNQNKKKSKVSVTAQDNIVRGNDQYYKTLIVEHSGQPQKRYKMIVESGMAVIFTLLYNLYHLYNLIIYK